ncbi:MAG: DUF4236 domain-containing protein [Firmicutes bacterium]|nr:DUF4236 domain-containing protein [Bacillota bacterium]
MFIFRRSIRLAKGVRLNLGKKGIGLSVGIPGLRVGVNRPRTYVSAGIPGTGIYSVKYLGKGKKGGRGTAGSGESPR